LSIELQVWYRALDAEVGGVPCLGLNIVGRPGFLVGVELSATDQGWSILGEWPAR